MSSRLTAAIALGLALMLMAAGCGSSNKSSSSGGSSSSSSSSSSSAGGSTPSVPTPQANQAAQACKDTLNRAAQLSPDVKKGLEKTCDKAAHGDVQAARKATEEVCVKVAEQAVPAGSARDQAVAACKKTAP